MRRQAYAALAVVSVLLVGLGVGNAPAQAQGERADYQAAAFKPINTGDRAAVRKAVLERLRPALATEVKWDGSASRCRAGKPSAATQKSTLKAINFFRAMGQLDPVKFDANLSARAQKAALIMDAEDSLSHFPPRTWSCYTKVGAVAAGNSNLCLGCTGADSIREYMQDAGAGNKEAGHRRWLLYPQSTTMGSGITTGASALWVFPTKPVKAKSPAWVSWPTPGYFPNELEPAGRWSLSASNEKVDFGRARVSVRTASGTKIKVQQHKPAKHGAGDYGSPALVWEVGDITLPSGTAARRIDVTVSGIRVWNAADTALTKKKLTRKYSIRFFNPDAR